MPTLQSTLPDLVIGDDYDVERNVTGIPTGTTLTTAWLTIKQDDADTDAQARIQKEITTVLVAGVGQITDSGSADLEGDIVFQLTAADTVLLNRLTTYVYDIQVKTSAGKIYTVERGRFTPVGQVTVDA